MVAVYALQGVQAPPVLSLWVDLVNDPVDEVGNQAIRVLEQVRDPDPVPALLKCIEKGPWPAHGRKQTALYVLSRIGDKRALPAFLAALDSSEENERNQGLAGLAALKDDSTREAAWNFFKKLPKPPAANVYAPHGTAIQLVKNLKEKRAAPVLLEWLDIANSGVRHQIADALPQLCGPGELPALTQALDLELVRFKRGDQAARQVLYHCIATLGALPSKEAAQALLGFIEKCPDQGLAVQASQQLAGAAVPEVTAEIVQVHARTPDAGVRRELENLLKNGKFDVHWIEGDKCFGLGPPKLEVEK